VISQVADAAFGNSWYGNTGHVLVQIATALILYTGAKHAVHRIPVPRQLHRRGLLPAPAADPDAAIAWRSAPASSCWTIAALGPAARRRRARLQAHPSSMQMRRVHRISRLAGLGMAKYYRTHQPPRLADDDS